MVGVKGYKYTTFLYFIYHLGDDDYRLNGDVQISVAPGAGFVLYNGIGHISNSWSYLGLDAPSGG